MNTGDYKDHKKVPEQRRPDTTQEQTTETKNGARALSTSSAAFLYSTINAVSASVSTSVSYFGSVIK